MKIGQRSLLGYLPAQVIKCVLDGTISQKPRYPLEIPLNTVSLFADISKIIRKIFKKRKNWTRIFSILFKSIYGIINKYNWKKWRRYF